MPRQGSQSSFQTPAIISTAEGRDAAELYTQSHRWRSADRREAFSFELEPILGTLTVTVARPLVAYVGSDTRFASKVQVDERSPTPDWVCS